MEIKRKDVWGLLLVLLLGQLVAFSMAVASFASSLIANLGVDAPLTQSFFAYLLLTLVYVPIVLHRRQKLQIPWYWYLALAFIDVQGNYLVVKAYQYSYITSVTLLDCWTVVWVIVLTWYALGTRYSFWQFVGAGTCVAGLALVLLSDAKSPDEQVLKYLKYADAHEWVKVEGDSATIGITDHAQEHLGDVVYVELPEVGVSVSQGNNFGAVESVKATSDINAPVSGEVVQVNDELSEKPGLVNESPYESGWILKVKISDSDPKGRDRNQETDWRGQLATKETD